MMYRTIICVLAIGMQPATVSVAAAQQAADARAVHPYAPHVDDAARRFAIPEAWIWAVMRAESNGDARAVSRAGAMGLMQIMPATADRLRLGDPFDAKESGAAGTRFLAELWARYRGDRPRVIAAYNVGPGAVPVSGSYTLPRETRIYVERVQRVNHRGQTSP